MNKFIEFCKDKYKILIPVMVGVVLLVTLLFLYREYKYDNTKNKKDFSVYQYYGGMKVEYTATLTYNLKESIVGLSAKDKKIEFDSTPVYFVEQEKILFPKEMTIVFPMRDASQYKLYKYATYYKEDDMHFIKNNTDVGVYDYFFLYDGKDVFFFPDETTLKINDKDYKKLGSKSYVSVVGGLTLVYYDTATETSEFIELNGRNVSVVNSNINVNISERYFTSFGNKILLFTPDNLNPVFKTIDK